MRFKTRLTLTFGAFAFLFCSLFAVLLDESLTFLESEIFESMLAQEADYLAARYAENPSLFVLPDLEYLKGFDSDNENFPSWLKDFSVGYHNTKDYQVLVRDITTNKRIYLVYDESTGLLDQQESRIATTLLVLATIVTIVGIFLGVWQAKILARPIDDLVHQVNKIDLKEPLITPFRTNDEIGTLSVAYADLINRLGQFIKREKAFTRYASHELMTPVSIIRNNLEILDSKETTEELRKRAITRLYDATASMQRQIEIFLMLARDDRIEAPTQPLDWDALLDDIKNRFPRISITEVITAKPKVLVNEAAVQVVLTNIMGNVIKHGAETESSYIAILSLDENSLSVSNDVAPGAGRNHAELGFGLEINEKVCHSIGWRFESHRRSDVFEARIRFA